MTQTLFAYLRTLILILLIPISACSRPISQVAAEQDVDLETLPAADAVEELRRMIQVELNRETRWNQAPEWADEIPFPDLKLGLAIPENENRELLYYRAIAPFDTASILPLFKEHTDPKFDRSAVVRTVDGLVADVRDAYHEMFDDDWRFKQPTNDDIIRIEKRIDPLRTFVLDLQKAQQRPTSFWHIDRTHDSLQIQGFASLYLIYLSSLTAHCQFPEMSSIEIIRAGLSLQRDLVPMSGFSEQISASRIERALLDSNVLVWLNDPRIDEPLVDGLIEVLLEHQQESQRLDPFLEETKWQWLAWRELFEQLASGNYDSAEKREELFLEPEDPLSQVLMREIVDFSFHAVNDESVIAAVKDLADQNPNVEAKLKGVLEELDEQTLLMVPSMIIAPLLEAELQSFNRQSIATEMKVLTNRYQEVEAACQLPNPQATKKLAELSKEWASQDLVNQTKILKWFLPHYQMSNLRLRRQLTRDCILCLAAIRKWQLAHPGQSPESLDQVFHFAGIDSIPADPFSEQTLRMIVNEGEIIVYSVGPDGVDNLGQPLIDIIVDFAGFELESGAQSDIGLIIPYLW